MSVWIPSSWPPFHPSHSETCGSTSKTQSQHLRAASENCGSIITRGSQGRLYLSVYLNFCNNLRQMRNVSVFSWVKLLYQPPPNGFPGKVVGRHFAFAICVATFVDAVPSPRSQKSNANCICRSRRTNFTFPNILAQTANWVFNCNEVAFQVAATYALGSRSLWASLLACFALCIPQFGSEKLLAIQVWQGCKCCKHNLLQWSLSLSYIMFTL